MGDVRGGAKLLLLSKYITEEDLSPQITGANTQFTLSNNYTTGTIRVFLNGLRQQSGVSKDWVEVAPNIIEFTDAPDIDDLILVDYIKV